MTLKAKEHCHWVMPLQMGSGTDIDNVTFRDFSYVGRRGWAHRQAHNIAKTGKALQNQSGMGVKDGGCKAELGIVGLERRCELGI